MSSWRQAAVAPAEDAQAVLLLDRTGTGRPERETASAVEAGREAFCTPDRSCRQRDPGASDNMSFYGPTWNNANRVMPDSGKRKVNIAIYGTERHDHTPSPVRSRPRARDRLRSSRTPARADCVAAPHLAIWHRRKRPNSLCQPCGNMLVRLRWLVTLCSPWHEGSFTPLVLLLCVHCRQAANLEEHPPCVIHTTVCHAYAAQ
eukprot:COSAG02_NODE_31_length_50774_cov_1928.118204_17_plen_203_part_00